MTNENILIATGYVESVNFANSHAYRAESENEEGELYHMSYTSDDVYRTLYDMGYGYRYAT